MQEISVAGLVATTPRNITTTDGVEMTSFRLASSSRTFDRKLNKWTDGETNWYTITSQGTLAKNVYASIHKGDRITLTGKLVIRDWDNGDRIGTSVEIEVDAIGHDLTWGESTFKRTVLMRDDYNTNDTNDKDAELEELRNELEELKATLRELGEEN